MEDKIEVGEYVRLANGKIFKCTNNYSDKIISNHSTYKNKNIVNHHEKIIKIIEVGDYVNGFLIVKKRKDVITGREKLTTEHTYYNWQGDGTLLEFYNEDIKSVITKEQFESMKYKVEG